MSQGDVITALLGLIAVLIAAIGWFIKYELTHIRKHVCSISESFVEHLKDYSAVIRDFIGRISHLEGKGGGGNRP